MSDDSTTYTSIYYYQGAERFGVVSLVLAGCLSITSVICASLYYCSLIRRSKTYHRTNLGAYLASLFIANLVQATGSLLNYHWVQIGNVHIGGFCTVQGILKNAGNVGAALWSFTIAAHVFNLLFLRWRTTRLGMIITLVVGWGTVISIVTLAPLVIENRRKQGPYFGISGPWCWITDQYKVEQWLLEYFFEFLSAGIGFILYSLVLLRVRGNLTRLGNRWQIRYVSSNEAWQLSFTRDIIDSSMLRVVKVMVWYPAVYSFAVVPIALARFTDPQGRWEMILADTIFNLSGFANSLLFIMIFRILPDTTELPQFSTRRSTISESARIYGVTPLLLPTIASSHASRDALTTIDSAEHGLYQHLQNPSYDRQEPPIFSYEANALVSEPQGGAPTISEIMFPPPGVATTSISRPHQQSKILPYEEHEYGRQLELHESVAPALPVALMNNPRPIALAHMRSDAGHHVSSRSRHLPNLRNDIIELSGDYVWVTEARESRRIGGFSYSG